MAHKNHTGLKKGKVIYYVSDYRYHYYHKVHEAVIESMVVLKDYILCRVSYIWKYATGPSRVMSEALFRNEPRGAEYCDLTRRFFVDEESANNALKNRLKSWRNEEKGEEILGR